MHDLNYRQRLESPEIKERILRNLVKIKDLGTILDFKRRKVLDDLERILVPGETRRQTRLASAG